MEQRKIEIARLYRQGVSSKEICAKCKCSTNTISKVLDEFNIPRRVKKKINKDLSKGLGTVGLMFDRTAGAGEVEILVKEVSLNK